MSTTIIALSDYAVMRGKKVICRCHTYEEAWARACELKGGYIQYRGCTPAEFAAKADSLK